jgi:iron complex outermembrane recepter protein
LTVPFASIGYAAEEAGAGVEEIVVTGSYIQGSAEDAALPIDVISQADMEQQGNPSLLELVRNLGVTSGNIGEENQFQAGAGQGAGAVTTINLRGLGAARTLVLVNSHRHVTTQALGVDISFMPQSALGRTEILKDGAAALYGSDAIAGVVNLITRGDFEGLEVSGSNQWIQDSDGQQNADIIWGIGNDKMHWMTAFEYEERNELKISDRDWALLPRPENPAGGWSGIANPATLYPAVYSATPGGPFLGTGGILAGSQADTQCANLGGAAYGGTTGTASCGFQYTFYDNIVNPSSTYRSWTEFNYDISDTSTLHLEGLYTRIKFDTNTSPSYPPQSLFGRDRWIAPTHPGLIQYKADNPTSALATAAGGAAGAYALARAFGSTGWFGDSQRGDGETNTYRMGASLVGDSFDGSIHYDIGVNYSHRERVTETPDTSVERMAFALDGLGGPNCVPGPTAVPGAGGCEYYNPFSNAISQSVINGNLNPQYDPTNTLAHNSVDLQKWLIQWQDYNIVNELLVWDAVLSGETGITLPGGAVGWAAGVQARNEKYDASLSDLTNRDISPCPFNDPYSVTIGNVTQAAYDNCQNGLTIGTGELGFLSAYSEDRTSRTIYAAFTEVALPIADSVDMQLAARFEDYGEGVGSTLDPKAAIRWQAAEWLTLRGSASTTFRGPPQSYLGGRVTSLQYITPANAFKAVDTVGNPDLEPETAITTNIGFIVNIGGFTGSVDLWEYNFSDPFQTESTGQMVGLYGVLGCQGPPSTAVAGAGYGTPTCNELSTHIFPLGTTAAALERVDTYIINGSDIDTSGVDFFVQYAFDDLFGGELAVGSEGSYTMEYNSDDFVDIGGTTLAPGGDFVGFYNIKTNPFLPLPDLKGNIFARYHHGDFSFSGTMRYVADYTDQAPSLPYLKEVDEFISYDVTALYNWRNFTVAGSVFNLTDEDPPQVSNDLNYDPNTVSAMGRMVKLELTYRFGDGE